MKHLITTTFSSLVAIALLVPQPAAATDDQTFPGAMCRADGENAKFFVEALNFDPNSAHSVVCPLVRDAVSAQTFNAALVFVRDVSSVEDVDCTLFSTRSDGSIFGSKRVTTSGASAINVPTRELDFVGVPSASGGFIKIICRIPRASSNGLSGILGYRIQEN